MGVRCGAAAAAQGGQHGVIAALNDIHESSSVIGRRLSSGKRPPQREDAGVRMDGCPQAVRDGDRSPTTKHTKPFKNGMTDAHAKESRHSVIVRSLSVTSVMKG